MSLLFKVKVCYINFILLLIIGTLTYISGFVLWLAIPRGQVRSRFSVDNAFLGLNRSSWEYIHITTSLLFLALIVIHLALNWVWIKNVTKYLLSHPKRE
ncbi:MAG: DUF4405 domain-containing protein [Ignisphaera sp.]|uniref:DUF4405 domain-containing protein n=1 Tax=Ignisphaera aggregans TaxID=334771 RepID=A0A7J3MYE0_9CREN